MSHVGVGQCHTWRLCTKAEKLDGKLQNLGVILFLLFNNLWKHGNCGNAEGTSESQQDIKSQAKYHTNMATQNYWNMLLSIKCRAEGEQAWMCLPIQKCL